MEVEWHLGMTLQDGIQHCGADLVNQISGRSPRGDQFDEPLLSDVGDRISRPGQSKFLFGQHEPQAVQHVRRLDELHIWQN